jgi:predicted O-methyltransferase YrrM
MLRGELDNSDLEVLLGDVVKREKWKGERGRLVIEVGTGGGRGSTAAIHRALTARNHRFQLVGYEGDGELAQQAATYWEDVPEVRVVNEYFMHPGDIDQAVKPLVAPKERDSYFPWFDARRDGKFLETPPPGPIDLLFIDSVRYTHLAILRTALPWLAKESVVVMEDDIPDYGELAFIESEFKLRKVRRHEISEHPWPLVEFKLARQSLRDR